MVVHSTQALVLVLQPGVAPMQSPSPRHCTQLFLSLQRGLPETSAQSPSARHCTHCSVVVLHSGEAPAHAGLLPHWQLLAAHLFAVLVSQALVHVPQ